MAYKLQSMAVVCLKVPYTCCFCHILKMKYGLVKS